MTAETTDRRPSAGGDAGKCVLVLAAGLPAGLAGNTAGVLAMSLGRSAPHLIGPDAHDADGSAYPGLTTVPLPVLTLAPEGLAVLAARARDAGLLSAAVTDAAQRSKNYADYTDRLAATATADLAFLGVALLGPVRAVNALTGSLPLLR